MLNIVQVDLKFCGWGCRATFSVYKSRIMLSLVQIDVKVRGWGCRATFSANHSIMLSLVRLVLVYVKFGGWGCRAMFVVKISPHRVKPSTGRFEVGGSCSRFTWNFL